ncbi:MAG TPA: D-alanine--D-alanine ligase [Gemmatimonadaceae bacterium]|nr:D-alanine--D-alanine ligase [Gemmatimonadaceae bacterium]
MRIVVLLGGTSSERDVSIASGLRIAAALRQKGHDVVAIDTVRGALTESEEAALIAGGVMRPLPPDPHALARLNRDSLPAAVRGLTRDVDVVFLGLHGGQGEDGTIQALLDLTGVRYTGSGHLASALAMDKDLSKRLFRDSGIPTPDWELLRDSRAPEWRSPAFAARVEATFGLPVIVKPSKEGSTVGLSLVKSRDALAAAVAEAFRHDDEVMIERFIAGRELTVGILGDDALPVGEIIPTHELYDYECKYTPGMAREEFPAKLTAQQAGRIQALALRAFAVLKLSGYARIDFRMTGDGEFYCLEANTLPGMTELSLIPQAAAAAGIAFPDLCDRIARLAVHAPAPGET